MDEQLAALKNVSLLSSLKRRHLELIARVTDRVHLEANTTLVEQGQNMTHMSIIITGHATVEVDGAHVGDLGPGDVIGEFSMVDHEPASATVICTEPTEIWHVAQAGFLPVWEKNKGDMAPEMLLEVIKKLRETNKLLAH